MARKWGGLGGPCLIFYIREIRIYLLPYILEYVGGVRVRIDFSRRRFFGLQILDFPGFGLRYLTL
jgi:hypothetical protein